MPDPERTIRIAASTAGVPSAAVCECGQRWNRPDDDDDAITLVDFGRNHTCTARAPVPKKPKA